MWRAPAQRAVFCWDPHNVEGTGAEIEHGHCSGRTVTACANKMRLMTVSLCVVLFGWDGA